MSVRPRVRTWRSAPAVLALWLCASPAFAQTLVVLSEDSPSYREVAEEVHAGLRGLRDGKLRVDVVTADRVAGLDAATFAGYELVTTVGLAAAQPTLARERDLPAPPPTLCVMIPRQSFERMATATEATRRLSALYIDQPLARQFELIRQALPGRRRVGVVLGPASSALEPEMKLRATGRDLVLNAASVADSSGVYGALSGLVRESDVLLVVPDPVATNADTVYGLLLTSYRAQLPVIGFSEGLAKAGALVSLYSTARQQGSQAAAIAAHVLAGGALPPPQYPGRYTVRVNASVARSLGLQVADEAALAEALSRAEGRP